MNFRDDSPTFKLLDELKLPLFHPDSTIYGVGHILENNYSFEFMRPLKVPPTTYGLDFVRTEVLKADSKLFGDYVFSGITPIKVTFIEINKTLGTL